MASGVAVEVDIVVVILGGCGFAVVVVGCEECWLVVEEKAFASRREIAKVTCCYERDVTDVRDVV